MNQEDARALIARVYSRIAPDVVLDEIDPDADFREEAEVDSMDFLSFVVAVKEETGLDIPEADYDQLDTLGNTIQYLVDAL